MTYHSTVPTDMVFVAPGTPMFSDLIERIQTDESLSVTRRRDLMSGLRRIATTLGRAPEDIPCDARWLQPRLARIAPAAHRITAKTWQNALSNARTAMAHFGLVEQRQRRIGDLSSDWYRLWKAVLASNDRTLSSALLRFVHFLSRQNIAPEAVSEEHALAYRAALEANEISKSPETAYRAAVNGWNLARKRITIWPEIRLALPSRQKTFKLAESSFPDAFIEDLDRLISRLATPDLLADDAQSRALRPATCQQYRQQIIRFASELVHAGIPQAEITSVGSLIDPNVAERGLRQMLSRNGNRTTKLISETAALLRVLSKRLDAPDEVRKKLTQLAARLKTEPQRGMTSKNRERLRALQDEGTQYRLLNLPKSIFTRPEPCGGRYGWLLAREDALAISILLSCPLRIQNIAQLDLERHIQRPGDRHVYLVFEKQDTKTGQPIEFELPDDVVKLLDMHLAKRAPELCPPGTPWLFPRRDGSEPLDPSALSSRISKRLRKEVGIQMNAHLFRHFAVMIWLDANPGGYEVARRLLGHSEASHTINLYSGLETRSAVRAFSDLVEQKRGRNR